MTSNPPRYTALLALTLLAFPLIAQQRRVDPNQTYERLIAIVPLQGAGTMADPKRPLFAPAGSRRPIQAPLKATPQSKSEILAFTWHLSDDGTQAVTEFVARDRAAFAAILNSKDVRVQTFERSKNPKAEMEPPLRR